MTGVTGGLVERDGASWYRIDGLEQMPPFLMTVTSSDDLWMFVSSAGPLTAGRVDADHALLPYTTDDRLHRSVGDTGPVTVLARGDGESRETWRPFGTDLTDGCTRACAKKVIGDALVLEEHNPAWGATFRMTWAPSPAHGWVRTVELAGDDDITAQTIEVLDGLLDVMPAGVDAATEQRVSNLVDAYKRSETGPWGTVALFHLESLVTDRAEPGEALAATVVWSTGLDGATVHLDERAVDDVMAGDPPRTTGRLLGRQGAYLLHGTVTVPGGGTARWRIVADTGLGHARVLDVVELASDPGAAATVADDVAAGTRALAELLAAADGIQSTADGVADAHQLSNVLFNSMRGGVFPYGHDVPVADLLGFLANRNRPVHDRHRDAIAALVDRADGETVALVEVHALADASDDPDLVRLVHAYLPLTFSRRHGDPSRPWNRFSIRVTDDEGDELLEYEGNWRDIFQNWEALLHSYPAWFSHVVSTFVDASTVDGHNPYRISRDGIDWETPDPDDPWANIGYWGDHQVIYLLRLLEAWTTFDPNGITSRLDRAVHTYADVPYRLATHDEMVAHPRDTITYDQAAADASAARVAAIGSDGRLVVDAHGELVRVTLAEKLVVVALAKLSAYVPGGGIWMNTQRPEWNDANNALAGPGLSLVTLYQLQRYLAVVGEMLAGHDGTFRLSRPVETWLSTIADVLDEHDPDAGVADPATRRTVLDALGRAGEAHRSRVQDGFDTTTVDVEPERIAGLFDRANDHLRATIAVARREDGLFHAYNLVDLSDAGMAGVEHLRLMLEGQVAVLGTTALDDHDVLELVDALFDSALLREDQGAFMLYPADVPPGFMQRNAVPTDVLADHPWMERLVGRGVSGILRRDADGVLHFRPGLGNADELAAALDDRTDDGLDLGDDERTSLLALYEEVFDHHAFTGRSAGMHGYEGLGSIYWHMVSKLLLAVQERHRAAVAAGADDDVVAGLAAAYRRVREGLGHTKGPAEFGAIPIDCYSHTPAHSGAQQPGMTGQVKEEVLARPGELGLVIRDGTLALTEPLLDVDELVRDRDDGTRGYDLTVCGTDVAVVTSQTDEIHVTHADGTVDSFAGSTLPREASASLFARDTDTTQVVFSTTSLARG